MNTGAATGYQGMPIGITVEGSNTLTRSLIIFGQVCGVRTKSKSKGVL
jgi:hypothetical protein